jgi:hypothetical protein
MSKECFVRLTDVMKIESFRKLISQSKEVFGQRTKRKSTNGTELYLPHKFMQKEVGQTESSKIVKRPRQELKTTIQGCKKNINYLQENLIDSKNSIKQDVKLFRYPQEVISSSRKSLNTSKTCARALRHERKCSPEVLASGSKTSVKQTTRSVSSELSVTFLKPKPIVPYTCSVGLTKFSQVKDGKVHELKHCDRFPVDVNTRSKVDKGVQVNFADASEAQQTGSTDVNTRSKHDKAVQVNFSDERENHRSILNIIDNKCGQEPATAGISTRSKSQEALQIKFAAEKYQHGLQIVISDKNKHKGVNGCPVMECECEEAVEPLFNEREDKDTDENAKDFNGGVGHVSLFDIKTGEANKADEAIIEEDIGGEFHESVQEKDGGEHSSEVHTNEVQEAVGSESHANVQTEEVVDRKRNYASEGGMNDGKKLVQNEYFDVQAHVAREDFQGGSYTNRAEIHENVQTDVAEDHERYYTTVTNINSGKEDIEREYHEGVPADVSEDDRGGNCQSRACVKEGKVAIKNVHHEGVEMDVADADQRENDISEGDKNEGLEAVESECYVHVQADVAEEHKARDYISGVIMNEDKEVVESEDDVPADTTEEGQKGKHTSKAERNEVQNASESEFYEDVYVEVAEIVVQGEHFIAEADANIHQESVESEFYENVKYVAEDSDRNEDQEAALSEFHEDMQVDGEECGRGNHTNEANTNEDQQLVSGGEAVESIFPETIQRSVSYEGEDQREMQTHESDRNEDLESLSGDGTVNIKFNKAVETNVKLGGIWTVDVDEVENQGAINESVGVEN